MKDKMKRMQTNSEETLIKQSCATCEFNFGSVCAGYGTRTDNGEKTYGMPMNEAEVMFPQGCEDYGISLNSFVEQMQMNEINRE